MAETKTTRVLAGSAGDERVKVNLIFGADEGDSGDEVEVTASRAKQLVQAGAGRYASAGAARAAGGDPKDPAETKTAKGKP